MSLARDAAVFASQPPKRKNLLINGSCRVSQRGATFPAASTNKYAVDRFAFSWGSTGVFTTGQGAISDTDTSHFSNYILLDVTTADTSIDAGDHLQMTHKIEGWDTGHLAWGTASARTVSLSFTHAHTKTGTYCIALRSGDNGRHYVVEYTQSVSDAWEEETMVIPGDTSGTWDRDALVGINVSFTGMCGTTFNGATNETWGAGNHIATTNQVNCVDSTANLIRFAKIQLEVGNEPTDHEQSSYAEDLALCERYYQKVYFNSYAPWGAGRVDGAGTLKGGIIFLATKMRATPTIWNTNTGLSRLDTATQVGTSITAATDFFVGMSATAIRLDLASEGTLYQGYLMLSNGNMEVKMDAEFY